MQIQSINGTYRPSFGTLIYDKSSQDKLPEYIVKDIPQAEKDLAGTRHWDLYLGYVIPGIPTCRYINKHNPEQVYTNGIDDLKINNKTVSGTMDWVEPLGDGEGLLWKSFVDLNFKTAEKAKQAFNVLKAYKPGNLRSETEIVKVLDSADEFIHDDVLIVQTEDKF